MGKRSDFIRVARDWYPTPIEAVIPLVDHLPNSFNYVEPCAGDARLINHISKLTDGRCSYASDIEPMSNRVVKQDALEVDVKDYKIDLCITNPPWNRKFLHPFIEHFVEICPTWLLFDADWMHTRQSAAYMPYCSKIVSVGRVKWIEDSKNTGKDNCCWYLFDKTATQTEFYGRKSK